MNQLCIICHSVCLGLTTIHQSEQVHQGGGVPQVSLHLSYIALNYVTAPFDFSIGLGEYRQVLL